MSLSSACLACPALRPATPLQRRVALGAQRLDLGSRSRVSSASRCSSSAIASVEVGRVRRRAHRATCRARPSCGCATHRRAPARHGVASVSPPLARRAVPSATRTGPARRRRRTDTGRRSGASRRRIRKLGWPSGSVGGGPVRVGGRPRARHRAARQPRRRHECAGRRVDAPTVPSRSRPSVLAASRRRRRQVLDGRRLARISVEPRPGRRGSRDRRPAGDGACEAARETGAGSDVPRAW